MDDTTIKIVQSKNYKLDHLLEFYHDLAAIYRFKAGDNQLEFLFDGSTHYEVFTKEWVECFQEWVMEFCKHRSFLKAVFEAAILYPEDRKALLAGNRFKVFLAQFFNLKVYKYRGILEVNAA